MKFSICVFTAFSALLFDAFSQDISYSGYLNEKISVSIDANTIQDAVRSVVEQSKLKFPDLARINFVFKGPVRPLNQKSFVVSISNDSLANILIMLRRAFNQNLEYDYLSNNIVFTTVVSTGDDPERKYHIENDVSAKLGIIWESEFKLIKSLQKHGVVANFSKVDLSNKIFVASGNIADLQYIDMLLCVGQRLAETSKSSVNTNKP